LLIDTGITSVSSDPKYYFLGIKDGGCRHLGKYIKGRILANSLSICTKFCMLVDIGNVGVQNSIFWKFPMAAVAVLENAQQGIFWSILDKFAPNLCVDKYGEYKGYKRPIMGWRPF